MTFHNIPAGLQIFGPIFNSGHEVSSCDPEQQHKQFCVRAYPFHRLFQVFFWCLSLRNQLQRIWSALDLEGSFVECGGFFLFLRISVVGIANPESLLIAASRLTNLAGISPCSLLEYYNSTHLLITEVVGQSSSH